MAEMHSELVGKINVYFDLNMVRLVQGNPRDSGHYAVYAFNLNGWLVSWCRQGQVYSCGLDGQALRSRRVGQGSSSFNLSEVLSPAELEQEVSLAQEFVRCWHEQEEYRDGTEGDRAEGNGGAAWGEKMLGGGSLLKVTPREVGERFRRVWGKVAILPPDQYTAAVVQLTQGCAYNGCRFCSFYKDTPYRVREAEEFAAHLKAVKEFFGAEFGERKGIFLADANAANIEDRRLQQALLQLSELAARDKDWQRCWQGGVASFLDTFSWSARSVSTWRALREAGLKSLYLGVETGSMALRRLWRKPGQPAEIVALVERLKEAGLNVGIIVISGAEAEFRDSNHTAETARLLNSLPLDRNDRIFISEYRSGRPFATEDEYVAYRRRCRQATEELQEGLRLPAYPQGALVSLYDTWQYLYR